MSVTAPAKEIFYPESDGLPMSDNTRQFNWIIVLATNLRALFRDHADVFVAGNQSWYPVEGAPEIRVAPDAYVVFGRPKGERPSYKQWEEGNVPMTVVFEVLSPSNTIREMANKLAFYDEHGVEEYYLYDPESNDLLGYTRRGETLVLVRSMDGFISPRLGIRFDLSGPELVVRYPDGRPFLTFEELTVERDQAEQHAEKQKRRAEQEKLRAEQEKLRAEQAEQRESRLVALTRKALRQQATAEELAVLERLLQEESPS